MHYYYGEIYQDVAWFGTLRNLQFLGNLMTPAQVSSNLYRYVFFSAEGLAKYIF